MQHFLLQRVFKNGNFELRQVTTGSHCNQKPILLSVSTSPFVMASLSLVAIIMIVTVAIFEEKSLISRISYPSFVQPASEVGDVAAARNCRCIIYKSKLLDGRCVHLRRRIPCTNKLPYLRNRRIRKTLVAFGNRLYKAYTPNGNKSCRIVSGSSYNNKFGVCIKRVTCHNKYYSLIRNGHVSKFYYALNHQLYRSYAPVCQ